MTKTLDKMPNYTFCDKHYADDCGKVYFNKEVKSSKKLVGDKLSGFINKYGYVEYIMTDRNGDRKHIQAHRIVASLFIPNPENKKYVNHIDGDKQNNTISNLEWCTASENEKHSFQVLKKQVWNKGKTLPSGRDYKGTIRPVASYTIDGTLVKKYFNPTEAEQDGYNRKQISAACNGNQKTHKKLIWRYLNESNITK